ncbi:MAG: PfkB family carbohydrate kinase [Treponema sp.]|jgi:sugar/nucleoside kinase (ribokinase family)|nr:PfkB family carbohydrate kinase [Treponema sp.]
MVELLCLGHAMVDIFAEAGENFCRRYGIVAPVQHVSPALIDLVLGALPSMAYGSGGGAANVAKIASLLGIRGAFAGSAGTSGAGAGEPDAFARLFKGDLIDAGVQVLLLPSAEKTGCCLVLTTPEGVKIAASPGAAEDFGPGDIPEELFSRAKAVVLDGYMLDREDLVRRVFELAARDHAGNPVLALDAGSVFTIRAGAERIAEYMGEHPLILFMNEEEAAALYGVLHGKTGGTEPPPVASSSRRLNPAGGFWEGLCGKAGSIIVLKQAEKGAVVVSAAGAFAAETTPLVPVDSTGAGDAFAAGFLAAFLRGKALEECAALGNRTAGKILAVPGVRISREALGAPPR